MWSILRLNPKRLRYNMVSKMHCIKAKVEVCEFHCGRNAESSFHMKTVQLISHKVTIHHIRWIMVYAYPAINQLTPLANYLCSISSKSPFWAHLEHITVLEFPLNPKISTLIQDEGSVFAVAEGMELKAISSTVIGWWRISFSFLSPPAPASQAVCPGLGWGPWALHRAGGRPHLLPELHCLWGRCSLQSHRVSSSSDDWTGWNQASLAENTEKGQNHIRGGLILCCKHGTRTCCTVRLYSYPDFGSGGEGDMACGVGILSFLLCGLRPHQGREGGC